jgi:hypothetical protein
MRIRKILAKNPTLSKVCLGAGWAGRFPIVLGCARRGADGRLLGITRGRRHLHQVSPHINQSFKSRKAGLGIRIDVIRIRIQHFAQSGSSSGSGSKLKQSFRRQFLSQICFKSKFESNQIKNIGVIHLNFFQKVVTAILYTFSVVKIFVKNQKVPFFPRKFLAHGSGFPIRIRIHKVSESGLDPDLDPQPCRKVVINFSPIHPSVLGKIFFSSRFHPVKSNLLSSGSTDGLVNVYDLNEGKVVHTACVETAILLIINTI